MILIEDGGGEQKRKKERKKRYPFPLFHHNPVDTKEGICGTGQMVILYIPEHFQDGFHWLACLITGDLNHGLPTYLKVPHLINVG